MQLPPPPPGAPGMFRCGSPGFLANLFRQARLTNVSEKSVTGKVVYGSNDTYWTFMNDVVAPVVSALSKADDALREKIKREVFGILDQKYADQASGLDYGTLIVYGQK